MIARSMNAQARRTSESGPARSLRATLRALVASISLTAVGCVAMPRPADPNNPATPPLTQEEGKAPTGDQARVTGTHSDFHETATDRQRFQVHIDFGRAFEAQGNLDAALQEYQDALTVVENKRRGPFRPADEALAHRRMGSAMDRLGRFAQAETHYKKALKLSPKDPKIWNDAGYSYYLQGRWADAERAFKTAARHAPDDERIRTNLGLTLAAAGRTNEALPLLSQSSGDAIGHANLGYLLAATGQVDLARQQYETALALRPDLQVARRALARMDLKEPDSHAPSRPPAVMAQGLRSTAHPIDPSVDPASTKKVNIPPPVPMRVLPRAIPPGPGAPQAALAAPGGSELVPVPPPPPL